jgi:hypothetical protein
MKSSDPTEQPRRKLSYFQPRQMAYLLTHERDLRDDQLDEQQRKLRDGQFDRLIEWSKNSAGRLSISRHRVLSFPATPPQPESPDVYGPELSPDIRYQAPEFKSHSPFTLIFADVKDEEDPAKHVDDPDLVELIIRLHENKDNQPLRQEGISLQLVSPSWLTGAGSETSGTGGPGGRPVPFKGATDTAPYEFQLPDAIEPLCPPKAERGKGVKVAILDTAPCLHDLAAAYERYQKVNPQNRRNRHPLIESLLKPNGPLHVHPASYDDLLRMRSVHLEKHNYKMTDHGLFVAGIIHTIAPSAEIHLYEVLNPDGVGDLESIAMGLWNVAEEQYRLMQGGLARQLVVNCSLVLNIPLEDTHPHEDFDPRLFSVPQWPECQGWPVERICDLLYALGSRVVAAAGNDREDTNRPHARYPAALNSALGVGALPKLDGSSRTGRLPTASYSNLSDRPEYIGVTTLGGEPDEGAGVLGLYLGKFPSPYATRRNTKDWAWWCGTSFATPIISGVTAAVLSGRPPGSTTEQAIRMLYSAGVIQNDQTDAHEDALRATQVYPEAVSEQ